MSLAVPGHLWYPFVVVVNFSEKRFPSGYRFDRLLQLDEARPSKTVWFDVIAGGRVADFGKAALTAWDVKVYMLINAE